MSDTEKIASGPSVHNSVAAESVDVVIQTGTINGDVHIHLPPTARSLDRRELLTGLMAIALGVDRLAVLPDDGQGYAIDAADVEGIDIISNQLNDVAFRYGGGTVLPALTGHLRLVNTRTINACPPQLRPRLLMAMANIATNAAWANYDIGNRAESHRLWRLSLKLTRYSDHPMADDFFVRQLIALNHQAIHLGNVAEALQIMELAQAVSRNTGVTGVMRSYVRMNHAIAHAAAGDAESALCALGDGVEQYNMAESKECNPWSDRITIGEVEGQRGQVFFLLSRYHKRFETDAVSTLDAAVVDYGTIRQRSGVMNLPRLAEAHLRAGERAKAIEIGHLACDRIPSVKCVRPYRRLLQLRAALSRSSAAEAIDLAARINELVHVPDG